MAGTVRPAPALICDADLTFLGTLSGDPKAASLPPVLAKSGKEAQLLLADTTRVFAGVFVSCDLPNPNAISVIRFAHLHRPATPVFLTHGEKCPFTPDELKRLGVSKALAKPMKYADFMSHISPSVAFFDTASAIDVAKQNKDKVDAEVEGEDANFSPIRAENFLAGSKSFFDIYVRLGSGRYLKLIQAGDAFSLDRVTGYIKKGVTHFYLRKEAQEHYIAYCDKLATAVLKSDKVSMNIRAAQILNQGEETFKFLKERGVSEVNLQYAASFMKNVNELIQQLKPGKQPILKGFLNDMASYDHGVAVSMIASMLINSLHMTSSDPVETVGIAAMFHDIGLYQLKLTEFDEDEAKMSEEQRRLYYTHPTVGASILQTLPRLKPVVIQAVAQHHERRNKKGFPGRIGPGSISLVADIVGIADEFQKIIMKIKKNPKLDLNLELEANIFNAFSNSLVNEFKRIFCFQDEAQMRASEAKRRAELAAKEKEKSSPTPKPDANATAAPAATPSTEASVTPGKDESDPNKKAA
ncbi:MAG: HD domain-containing protein [Bdellovibrio sp.]|nr:HD domain-containing protein [Bdellovibrio sp.]